MPDISVKKSKKRWLIPMIGVVLATVLCVVYFAQNREVRVFPDLETISPPLDSPIGKAGAELLAEYQTVMTATEADRNQNAEKYAAQYPRVNLTYVGFYHMGLFDTLFAAYYDIDQNGTDELFIGIGDKYGPTEVGVYAFTGETFVPLSITDSESGYQIFPDGTFLQTDGGGAIIAIKHISKAGFTLEDTEVPDLTLGAKLTDIDIATYEYQLDPHNWAKVPLK